MAVLGISGRNRDAAAALAVDGRVVAAATEDSFARVPGIGYAQTGGFPHNAVRSCLEIAGLEAQAIQRLVVVDDTSDQADDLRGLPGLRPSTRSTVDAVLADARQVAMNDPGAQSVLVLSAEPAAFALFRKDGGGELNGRVDIAGAENLVGSARALASALGLPGRDPFASLDRLSVGAEAEYAGELRNALRWDDRSSRIEANEAEIERITVRVAGEHADGLADARSLNARVHQIRRGLAASFTTEVARIVARVAEHSGTDVALGGSAFGNGRLNTELAVALGSAARFGGVPEAPGRALGAVGASSSAALAASNLALGPAFTEEAIKRTLDNCRLDYVYEPDWKRLLRRVSRMLAQGKIVGWFQGPMAFGPRALGTRSILADPSNRYARQNVNEYLRGLPMDEPLPVAFAPSAADKVFAQSVPPGVVDAPIQSDWRQPLAAALDTRQTVRLHGHSPADAPTLFDLLDIHFESTGTPGLIETNLAGRGEAIACTPRDAVRTVYSSAIDALVIGRFLLMKDYWLLRTEDK